MKDLSLLFVFLIVLLSCEKKQVIVPENIPEQTGEEKPVWKQLSGTWTIGDDTVYSLSGENGTPEHNILLRGDTDQDTRWRELSVCFKMDADIRHNAAGLALHVKGTDDFGILRVSMRGMEVGRWKYNHYQSLTKYVVKQFYENRWYKIRLEEVIKENDWRRWTVTLTDCENGKVLIRQGIENTFPLFGGGAVGLYSFVNPDLQGNQVSFKDFEIQTYSGNKGKKYLQLAPLFTDGMVLQRNMVIPVWGFSKPNMPVRIDFNQQMFFTFSDNKGKWRVSLPPMSAGTSLDMLVVSLSDSVFIRDIDIGEVWVASGQSNMAMMVWQSDMSTIAGQEPPDSDLRMFIQPQWPSEEPVFSSGGKWEKAEKDNVREWSAAAYSFALQLRKKLHVPVGIVASYWGGTTAECWMPREVLATNPVTEPILDDYTRAQKAMIAGLPVPSDIDPLHVPDQWQAPGYLYNGMIFPHIPYAIQGVIWYQGESNASRPGQYRTLFPLLIQSWREAWNIPDLYFLFVQLAGYDGKLSFNNIESAWPCLREAQRLTLNNMKHTGMVVTIDIGDRYNIHPYYKKEVGTRLARWALHDIYKFENIIRSGPLYDSARFTGKSVEIFFSETGSGLRVRNGESIHGFVIAGADGKFYPAAAKIGRDRKSVFVWSVEVTNPMAVRYAWSNFPVEANLINSAGLPASPFRTDDWPVCSFDLQ